MPALQPLYLDAKVTAVALEGAALRVSTPACADARFPLRRLARVVVRGGIPFANEALLGCLSAGVPVTFLAPDGQVLGQCWGRDRPAESLDRLLDRLIHEPAWRDTFESWARHIESRAIRDLGRRLQMAPALDLRPAETLRAVLMLMPGGNSPGAVSLFRGLDGLMRAHLGELIVRAGISARFCGGTGSALDLRQPMAQALGWYLWPAAAGLLNYYQQHPPRRDAMSDRRQRIVKAYEATAPRITAQFQRAALSLECHLRESLS